MTALITGFISCKKQEIVEPTVTISYPKGHIHPVGSFVPLKAIVTDPEALLAISWTLLGPDGDTVMNINPNEKNYNLGTQYSIEEIFRHGQTYYSTGVFTWKISVANNYITKIFNRTFQVGAIDVSEKTFAIASIERNSRPYRVTLYDELLQKFKAYDAPENAYNMATSGKYMYGQNRNGFVQWNGFTGKEQKTLFSTQSSSNIKYYYSTELYLSGYSIPSYFSSYGKSGNQVANVLNYFSESTLLLKVDENIFSIEYDQNSGRTKLVTYNASTGAYIANVSIQQNVNVYGLFSFGNKNRIYVVTSDPTNSYKTVFWYFNQGQNSIAQLAPSIEGRAISQNPIIIDNSKAWVFTNEGIYEFSSADQAIKKSINSSTQTDDISYYDYSATKNLLLYQVNNYYFLYDIQEDKEIGYISNNGEKVQFLE